MNILDRKWHTKHAGLFTFAQSAKHVGLYQKFGFWPRFLTIIMSRPVWPVEEEERQNSNGTTNSFWWTRFSEIPKHKQEQTLDRCRLLTTGVYDGLDLKHEIVAVNNQNLGDTILLYGNKKNITPNKNDNNNSSSLAGSEAGSGICYVKFGVVISDGSNSQQENFKNLLNAASLLAKDRHLSKIVAGVNTERSEAYDYMVACGFRADMQGMAMHRPSVSGYNRSDVYLIDDWR
jgi:hypothetical protein